MEHLEHKKEKRNERAAIQLGLFLVGLLLFGTAAGGQLTGEEKNGKEKAAIQTSGVVSDAVEPKKIALTFDDGPHPVYTKILLDGLAERGAKASFFVTGENAEKYPGLILRMQKEGHLIGNHTYSHIQLTSNNREAFRQELISTNEVLKEITGAETIFVRPPYGSWDKGFEQELNMFPVLWTIDPLDWCSQSSTNVEKRILSKARENAIILLHDEYASSIEAALFIVDELQSQGYVFVTVEEIMLVS
jgi:peptidoglycan/xylan/chitin deacetylase (PgdA/CDA1 family)